MTLLCALEFGKRVYSKKNNIIKITTSKETYNYLKDEYLNKPQEYFIVLYLNTQNEIIKKQTLFIGTINSSKIYARDIFREAVRCNAYSMILSHNHPSGNTNPSIQDVYLTNELIKLGNMMNIYILDHLIIGVDSYYSFLDNNPEIFDKKAK